MIEDYWVFPNKSASCWEIPYTLPSAADLARGADATRRLVPIMLELTAQHTAEADQTISEWIANSDPADTKYEKDGESGFPAGA